MSTISQPAKSESVSSHVVRAGKRTYFFDVWTGPKGGVHLTVSQTSIQEDGVFASSRIVVFDRNVREFYEGFCEAIRSMREEQKKREAAPAETPSAKPVRGKTKAA
jgi:hypothetical protein